jgi:hypothetical protein
LLAWLIRAGGIQDLGGDVRQILGEARQRPGLINSKGATLDDATLRAWEAGFLPGKERPSINDLFDAIVEDLHDNRVVRNVDKDLAQQFAEMTRMEAELERYGVAGAKTPGEVRAILDNAQPVGGHAGAATQVGGRAAGAQRPSKAVDDAATVGRPQSDVRSGAAHAADEAPAADKVGPLKPDEEPPFFAIRGDHEGPQGPFALRRAGDALADDIESAARTQDAIDLLKACK